MSDSLCESIKQKETDRKKEDQKHSNTIVITTLTDQSKGALSKTETIAQG